MASQISLLAVGAVSPGRRYWNCDRPKTHVAPYGAICFDSWESTKGTNEELQAIQDYVWFEAVQSRPNKILPSAGEAGTGGFSLPIIHKSAGMTYESGGPMPAKLRPELT